jgi:hypothetical protein
MLMDLPDLTRCLISDVASIHLQQSVTMAPTRGGLTLSLAHGTIVNETPGGFSWHPPAGIEYRGAGNESVLVEMISEVQAEKILVTNTRHTLLKRKGCLSDFGTPTFCLPVPLDMLREKCGSPDSERAATATTRRINTNHNLMTEAYQLS